MSKRKVQFQEEEIEIPASKIAERAGTFKSKHSLDSDEEDEDEDEEISGEKYRLKSDDLEGQEDTTITHDGNIKITPFNLKEEMEDGYFDADGNYFESDEKEIHDEWLDSAEFQKIHELKDDQKMLLDDNGQFDDAEDAIDRKDILSQALKIMKPGETVTKAIKRLGASGGSISASARLKAKKQKIEKGTDKKEESEESKKDKQMLLDLTGLADKLLQVGDYYIYQENFQQLSKRLEHLEETEEDDELEAAFNKTDKEKSSNSTDKPSDPVLDEVLWQYKWENKDEAEIFGPFSSSQMLEWQEQEYFKSEVWVRKVAEDQETPFYNSKRIDFDLYT